MTTFAERLEIARWRIRELFGSSESYVRNLSARVTSHMPSVFRPALTEQERMGVAQWMNSELFADRSREFTFNAVDPRTGQTGEFRTSVNGLLMVEPSYDTAKAALQRTLTELESSGLISRRPPASRIKVLHPQYPSPNMDNARNRANVVMPHDTRISTGRWADFPPYGGIANSHLNVAGTAIGFTQPQARLLEGFPLPGQWVRYYPGSRFYEKSPSGQWTFGNAAFVDIMDSLTVNVALLIKGANGNPEFHPAVACFNNGSQFASPGYPPDLSGIAYDDVAPRYQYKEDHRWAVTTVGARGSATGFTILGKQDALWLSSLNVRQRVAQCENHQLTFTNDWGIIRSADAVASFFQWVNLASFLVELGATAHVHACTVAHNALANKAMREMNLPVGGDLDSAVAREREARGMRVGSRTEELDNYLTQLQAVTDRQVAQAEAATMDIIRGGVVASAQLFMANPIAGGVGLIITGVAAAMAYIFGGGLAERPQPEQCLIRDGSQRIRPTDDGDDPQGDIYGGNYYPWKREQAIRGIPCLRAKDAAGRIFE